MWINEITIEFYTRRLIFGELWNESIKLMQFKQFKC